jgi:hypothetical protein
MSTSITQIDMIVSEQELSQLTLLAERIANEFNLDMEEVFNRCLPKLNTSHKADTGESTQECPGVTELPLSPVSPSLENTQTEVHIPKSKTTKSKKTKITNYKDAVVMEDLKAFKLKDLKDILKEHKQAISGSKKVLMERVWNLVNSETKPNEEDMVEGVEETKTTEDANETSSVKECELDPSVMPTFYVKDGCKVEDTGDGVEELKLFKNKWLFKENADVFDFRGVVSDGGEVEWLDEVPDELVSFLGMDD